MTQFHTSSFCVAGVALMALGGALGSGLRAPWSRVTPRALCMAGAPLGDIYFRFTWQAWQAWQAWLNPVSTSGFAWQTRYSWLEWRAWVAFRRALVVCDTAVLCVAGVVLGNILFRFMWQAWRNFPSLSVLRGRRGTHGTGGALGCGLGARPGSA